MKLNTVTVLALCQAVTAVKPVVDLGYSKFQGTLLDNGITQWLGMPFAAPPVGDLRWRAPRDPAKKTGVVDASKVSSTVPAVDSSHEETGDDCIC